MTSVTVGIIAALASSAAATRDWDWIAVGTA